MLEVYKQMKGSEILNEINCRVYWLGEQGAEDRERKDCSSLVKNQVWKIMMRIVSIRKNTFSAYSSGDNLHEKPRI